MLRKMYDRAKKILVRGEAASMAEYAILLALITVALVVTITAFGDSIKNAFTNATNTMNTTATGGSGS